MNARQLIRLLPLIALQSGCALLTTSYNEGEQQIEQWVAQQQYGSALKALSRVEPTDPHYLEAAHKRKQVEVLAAAYEQEVRQQNSQRLERGNWAAALDSYDEALARLPESAVLKDGLAQLHLKQAQELKQLELKRLKEHGNWLKKTLPTFHDIARVDPRNRNAKRNVEAKQSEAETVADALALHGNRAMADNELESAAELLGLAAELSSAPAIHESLNKLNHMRSELNQQAQNERKKRLQQQRAAEQRRQNRVNNLLGKYEQAFANNDFASARQQLQSLADAGLETSRYRSLQQQLNSAIDKESSRLFELGVNAYSRGHYAKAADHWRQVLALRPENKQAKEHLERAERVLEKLQELEQKQSSRNR